MEAYNAPFPDDIDKARPRILPSLVSISVEDPEYEANKNAIELFKRWDKPFLTAFSDGDPINKDGEIFLQEHVPGAKGQTYVTIKGASHFLQEDKGEELA